MSGQFFIYLLENHNYDTQVIVPANIKMSAIYRITCESGDVDVLKGDDEKTANRVHVRAGNSVDYAIYPGDKLKVALQAGKSAKGTYELVHVFP